MDEALYLTELAAKVTVVHRGDQLRATRVLQERAMAQPKIAWRWHTVVEGIEGSEQVERLRLTDVHTGESSLLPVAGVFIYVGLQPNTGFLQGCCRWMLAGMCRSTSAWKRHSPVCRR